MTLQVVPKHSACIPGAVGAAKIAILSDHTNIVKFKSAEDPGFRKVNGELSIMLSKALRKIEQNWKELANAERSGLVTNLPATGPYMDAPVVTGNIAQNVDQSLRVSYSIPMHLPFHKNKNFTGRDRELVEIHKALHSPDALFSDQNIAVLHGLGGIGKTQLAIQYAYTRRKDYTSVWWVNASTTQSLSQGFLGIAQQLLSYHAKKNHRWLEAGQCSNSGNIRAATKCC